MKNHKSIKFIILLCIIALAFFISWYFNLSRFLSFDEIRTTVESYGAYGPIIFIGLYILTTCLFLPATPMTIASGFLFGPLFGTIYVVFSASIGAIFAFIVSKFLGEGFVSKLLRDKFPKLDEYDKRLAENGFVTVLILRFIPLFPFNGLNLALGLTKISTKDYFWATFLGTIPGSFVYVYFGDSLESMNMMQILFAFILIFFITSIAIWYKRMTHAHRKHQYDVIAIGAGAAGLNMVSAMNALGFKTLLIEKNEQNIGGDCLNSGCIPSKSLIHVAKIIGKAVKAKKFGLTVEGNTDFKKVTAYISNKIKQIKGYENAQFLREKGIDVVIGHASFMGKDQLVVNETEYKGKYIVIATGSKPRKLEIPGVEKVKIKTNETIFALEKLPEKLVIIGGGPIGVEIAQAFNHLGSKVTIVNLAKHLLPKEDKKFSKKLQNRLSDLGITILNEYKAKSFPDSNSVIVSNEKEEKHLSFDEVFVAIGRDISFEGMNLEKAGIATDIKGKLVLDEYLRTTNKKVFACGDSVSQQLFTHATELHAKTIIRNFFSPFKKKLNTDYMAWVTYTDPEIATFGLNKEQLDERGEYYEVVELNFENDDKAIVDEYPESLFQLYIGERNIVLGGCMMAPNAGELIQELILVNTKKLKLNVLFDKVYPYPTATRINKQMASTYMKKKLTPFMKKILKGLFYTK